MHYVGPPNTIVAKVAFERDKVASGMNGEADSIGMSAAARFLWSGDVLGEKEVGG
jgi:hypothetical protein